MTKLKELSFLADASSERSKRQGTSRAAQQQLQSSRGSDLSPTNTDDIDYDKTGETLEDEDGEIMGVPAQNNARCPCTVSFSSVTISVPGTIGRTTGVAPHRVPRSVAHARRSPQQSASPLRVDVLFPHTSPRRRRRSSSLQSR